MLQILLHVSIKQKTFCMKKWHALNAPNCSFWRMKIKWRFIHYETTDTWRRNLYKPKVVKIEVIDLAQIFLTLFLQQDFMYSLVKLEKTLKTPQTSWEKRTKYWFWLCIQFNFSLSTVLHKSCLCDQIWWSFNL